MKKNKNSFSGFLSGLKPIVRFIFLFVWFSILGIAIFCEGGMRIRSPIGIIMLSLAGTEAVVFGLFPIVSKKVRFHICKSEEDFLKEKINFAIIGFTGLFFMLFGIFVLIRKIMD